MFSVVRFVLSHTGPLIISFGTFPGLILFLEVFLNIVIPREKYFKIYFYYLLFLSVSGEAIISFIKDRIIGTRDPKTTSNVGDTELGADLLRRQKILKVVFSFGLSNLKDWFLEKNGITFYDVFGRPSYWTTYPENQKESPIIRIHKKGKAIEIRFPKNLPGKVLVRETKPNSIEYEDLFKTETWENWKELFLLCPVDFLLQIIK